ncbi:hypothetical protein N332_12026, partial [Mesitornis unicolor]
KKGTFPINPGRRILILLDLAITLSSSEKVQFCMTGQEESHIWCSCLCCSILTMAECLTYAFTGQGKKP